MGGLTIPSVLAVGANFTMLSHLCLTILILLTSAVLSLTTNSSETTSDQIGAGRTFDYCFGVLGKHLEQVVNRQADKIGFGPNALMRRIRSWRCLSISESYYGFASVTHEDKKKIRKISLKFLEYAWHVPYSFHDEMLATDIPFSSSPSPATQFQSLQHIRSLAADDPDFRDSFREIGMVEFLQQFPQRWNCCTGVYRRLLSHSSRKALDCVENNEVDNLVKQLPQIQKHVLASASSLLTSMLPPLQAVLELSSLSYLSSPLKRVLELWFAMSLAPSRAVESKLLLPSLQLDVNAWYAAIWEMNQFAM